jgi:hypothetical protein
MEKFGRIRKTNKKIISHLAQHKILIGILKILQEPASVMQNVMNVMQKYHDAPEFFFIIFLMA